MSGTTNRLTMAQPPLLAKPHVNGCIDAEMMLRRSKC